ncbi:MAG: hypothetical protein SFV21_16590 [Rhodospirillaceae bacterium]|nr:hypothetical protein [Rhodospirillaceae bacterium]
MTKQGVIVHVNKGGVGFLKESNSDHHYVFNFGLISNTAPSSAEIFRRIKVGAPVEFSTSSVDSEVVTDVRLQTG